ncbi:MAG TPA: SUMF1/EgtB/PvdO family nonheme iron enzyme [Phototrophicaceae bacterium]|nr:SUMF1/EgtB/PvdO family nonheme iron enzyme [Phototrophicaceae bacterium]
MSIFISYRRSTSKHLAQLIFRELRQRGHDAFLDVTSIDSGAFDRIILNQIAARPHFLLILSPGSLERCVNEGDWLRREVEEAFRLKRNIIPIFDEGFNIEQERQYLPEPIRTELARLNAPPYSHYYFDAFMDTVCNRFLKQPVYDVLITPTPTADHPEVQRRIAQAAGTPALAPSHALDLLPPPFAWCEIPAGKVTLILSDADKKESHLKHDTVFDVPTFAIAKYPVTNAQFAKFIEANGYQEQKWWTDAGWQAKTEEKWTEPRYWTDAQWNGADYPVVGVSWYEAVAFCRWLSAASGEKIMLSTEQQWQRATQGNDGRAYPWGQEWDGSRCNHSVGKDWEQNSTSPVTRYEGLGDSPFGVLDLAGNVWEWCLTAYKTGNATLDGTDGRVLRGGSWLNDDSDDFRASFRLRKSPDEWFDSLGFRCVRSG